MQFNRININRDELVCFQIKPDRTIRNYNTQDLIKAIAELYQPVQKRLSFDKKTLSLTYKPNPTFFFETWFHKNQIRYFFLVPQSFADYFKRKAEATWEKATIEQIEQPPQLNTEKSTGIELSYKRHNIFSMNIDARTNAPLTSLLAVSQDVGENDAAVIQLVMQPVNRLEWEMEATNVYDKFRQGKMPRRPMTSYFAISSFFATIILAIMKELFDTLGDLFAEKKPKKDIFFDPEVKLLLTTGLTDPTKPTSAVVESNLRIAAQSDEKHRALLVANGLSGAFKDIAMNNELDKRPVKDTKQQAFARQINNRQLPVIKINGNIFSVKEAGKLIQLPTAELQKDFPSIVSNPIKEVALPDEILNTAIKGVRLGTVIERGRKYEINVPMEAYGNVLLKHVYDALCTVSFGQGKQGSGKTDGFGGNYCYWFVVNGFTTIIIDTADGQGIKNFEDALPEDYPESKLIHLEFDQKAWPIPLNWSDAISGLFADQSGDKELETAEIAEKMTSRFKEFVEQMATGEFTDRMDQYLSSCMRAVTTKDNWSFLDVELALKSPAYREELLSSQSVQQMPEILDDLNALQEKAAKGTDGPIIDPIVSRLKVLSNNTFLQNMFYQPPKLDKNGKSVLDFRRWIDNAPTGNPAEDKYGYTICIHASEDAWQGNQSLILGFIEDKINFVVFSRVNIDQKDRKPCVSWIDEPHKVIRTVAKYYKNANVEFRKYRCKRIFTGHSIDQMGEAAKSLMEGGAQFTSYKTESLDDIERFSHIFKPYDNARELYEMLPDKWVAINKVRLPSNTDCPAFICHMAPPPKAVKSREDRRQACAKEFGNHWKDVSKMILEKRRHYQKLDAAWHESHEDSSPKRSRKAKNS